MILRCYSVWLAYEIYTYIIILHIFLFQKLVWDIKSNIYMVDNHKNIYMFVMVDNGILI